MSERIVVASNHGPVSFEADGTARRGGGGLASALGAVMEGGDNIWVAATMTDGDRAFAAASPGSEPAETEHGTFRLRFVPVDPSAFDLYYDVVSNRLLWFALHRLFNASRRPYLDRDSYHAWDCFTEVNAHFADACANECRTDDRLLVQDYHLPLVPAMVRERAPGVRIAHFTHTAWPAPDNLALLPDPWVDQLLRGMLGADVVGFHSRRWARNFAATVAELGLAEPVPGGFLVEGRPVRLGIFPLGPDPDALVSAAESPETEALGAELDELLAGRRLILRVERLEPAKNAVRGLRAYEMLLEDEPELVGRVVYGAQIYPSRGEVPEYIAYRDEVDELAARLDDRFPGSIVVWQEENFPRSLAAYQRYDCLVVNSIADGLNLVAKEGPILNERDGMLVLSRETGAIDQMERAALMINPFDTAATAAALSRALHLPDDERARRAKLLREAALEKNPTTWLNSQLHALTLAG